MANVNTKFIANPAWGIQNVSGQALTFTVEMVDFNSDNVYDGYGNVWFDESLYGKLKQGLIAVTPGAKYSDGYGVGVTGVEFITRFIAKNPIHCRKMNVRANSAGLLPTSIEIQTPNIFTGQMDRQIINVTADSNMYQNQGNIVTIDCDFFLCRESVIVFNVGSIASSTQYNLNIDFTFDKYISLEKALVENYQLLQTTSGAINAVEQEISTINTVAAEKLPILTQAPAGLIQADRIGNNSNVGAVSVQPARTRGNNFWR